MLLVLQNDYTPLTTLATSEVGSCNARSRRNDDGGCSQKRGSE